MRTAVGLSLLLALVSACGDDGDGAGAASPAAQPPRFSPVMTAEHLPPSLRALTLGATTLEQAAAVFPAADHLSIRRGIDSTLGGDGEWVTKRGPNTGLRYNRMEVVRVQANGEYQGSLGENYARVAYRFARAPGEPAPVLHYLEASQLDGGAPHLCAPAHALSTAPESQQGCPEGVTPRIGGPDRFTLCVGSPDGQQQVVVECMGTLVEYEMVLPQG